MKLNYVMTKEELHGIFTIKCNKWFSTAATHNQSIIYIFDYKVKL